MPLARPHPPTHPSTLPQLVPGGRGELVMRLPGAGGPEDENDDPEVGAVLGAAGWLPLGGPPVHVGYKCLSTGGGPWGLNTHPHRQHCLQHPSIARISWRRPRAAPRRAALWRSTRE